MRIFALSDLHTDYSENVELLASLCTSSYKNDTLIVAGDLSENLDIVIETLNTLNKTFKNVFFTPGNHDLWLENEPDSVVKFNKVISKCNQIGVYTTPQVINNVCILPLFSWYDSSLEIGKPQSSDLKDRWMDYHKCKWPFEQESIANHFYGLNSYKPSIQKVVTFSHFVPRRELIPTSDKLTFKELPWVAGSNLIEKQLREVGSNVHIFGHTHIDVETSIDNVTYISHTLKYPDQRDNLTTQSASFKEVILEK